MGKGGDSVYMGRLMRGEGRLEYGWMDGWGGKEGRTSHERGGRKEKRK